ncbi:hypothetical protein CP360_04230 [Lactobacillus sp. UMNPBX9]|nr:hypothetical protein CP360_04230 [Lactobacillus sp. UMNPBX9]PEH10448.1 hypothetical protein CP353_02885 [Lactobacillus sp. UMNPBX2]
MKETRTLEYKEIVSKSFLKTVSAYANYGKGKILFGVTDSGEYVGVQDPVQTCLDIENRINDSITPKPSYTLDIIENKVVSLEVKEGVDKPYFYKGKAYKRNDTSSIEVSRGELNRLILEGSNRNYDELPASNQNLTFKTLEKELKDKIEIQSLSKDILRTLNLYNQDSGFNNAAELLSDNNSLPGIDIIRFGEDINEIRNRQILENESVLVELNKTVEIYQQYYQYEQIDGLKREKKELIPEVAFREAVANTLVHRAWDIPAKIRISMFDNRIEITSPGGLPFGMSREEYLQGLISVARNPILANVFFRLKYIEMFGTGIRRIKRAYQELGVTPEFKVSENSVTVILPVIANKRELTVDEEKIIKVIKENIQATSSEISTQTGINKSKVVRLLRGLVEDHFIIKIGAGRATKYHL